MKRVPPSEICDGHDPEDFNQNGDKFIIVNFSSGLHYMYIIDKPFKGYLRDDYKAIDFIEFHYNDFYWPIFNIADAAIFAAVTWIIIKQKSYFPAEDEKSTSESENVPS